MRIGVTTDFFVLCVLIVFHTKQYFLPESEALWPLNQVYALHKALMIINSLLSTWKGWRVDGSVFYAFHHAITGLFFYYTTSTTSATTYKYLVGMAVYLFMRIFKRLKDAGEYTLQQWIEFYVSYTYIQTGISLMFTIWVGHTYTFIDIVGYVALLDSTYTCRKLDLTSKLIERWPIFVPHRYLKSESTEKVLAVLEGVTLWMLVIIPFHYTSNDGKIFDAETLLNPDTYRALIALLFVDLVVKKLPGLGNFKRPHTYSFTKSGSFPSAHAALAIVVARFMGPLWRLLLVLIVSFYRVASRSHTLDDVCAGLLVGDMFNTIWFVVNNAI